MANPLFDMLAAELASVGLGALFTTRNGQPGGWLWNQIQSGNDTSEMIMLALEQTDVFKDRFAVIVEQKKRAGAGQPVYVMSPAEVIEYENRARQIMSAAGMPDWFYDQPDDFNQLILNDISVVELERRVVQAYEYVNNAPDEVRQKFREFYGVAAGDKALAAYVLDPGRTTAQLERAVRTAYTAGMAERFDLTLSKSASDRIAQLPRTEAGIVQGLEEIARQGGLFDEGLFETTDLSAEVEGVASVFEGDAGATTRLQRRQIERAAPRQATTGGAALTNEGLVGARQAGGR